jgi:predicted nucleic acid-binding protein
MPRPQESTGLIVAEPPAIFRILAPLVVDASVLTALLFDEPQRDEARNRLESEAARAALRMYESTDIRLLNVDGRELVELAERYRLTAYDAAYLWVAAELRAPLITFDARLGEAARQHLGSLE